MVVKLLLKISLLAVIIAVVQQTYYHGLGSMVPAVKKTSRMDFRFRDEVKQPFDVAFIASSINFTTAKTDTDKRDIAEMLDDNLDCHVLDVSRGGNNVDLYDEITHSILNEVDSRPVFVYEISVRTFGQVYNEPSNARSLKDDEYIFKDNFMTSIYHALNVFRYDFGLLSEKEFDKLSVHRGTEYLAPLDVFMQKSFMPELTEPQKKFLINYMGRILPDNPKLKALEKLCRLAKKEDLDILFLIPPENYKQGIAYFPTEFEREFDANISIIKALLDSFDCPYINLSKGLNSKNFTHTPLYPNGHLTQQGRRFVANQITQNIECPSSN